ncbi:MAG TPA: hypothetical protein DD611_04115 [Alphaproteobacteria bacterium]|nr:hypothetical protein [Alphaproteobacteria bacterium]
MSIYNRWDKKENKLAQQCIFCGKKPENKNKEHVIPQWLSKLVGSYDHICNFGLLTEKHITFGKLTFPACTACNTKFGELEAAAKIVLEKVMAGNAITATEINTLLDWFDKVRVGLWLGQLMLVDEKRDIEPQFHIADRIGTKDRLLIVERLADPVARLGFSGTNTETFMTCPSAFQLCIGDYLFTNASEMGLVANRLGYPQISKIRKGVETSCDITPGRGKPKHPVVASLQASPYRTLIYQPMFKCFAPTTRTEYYNVPYVLSHSLDMENGVGGVFYQRGDNTVRYLGANDKINIVPRKSPENVSLYQMTAKVYDLQRSVLNLVDYAGRTEYFKSVADSLKNETEIYKKLMHKLTQHQR